LEIPIDIAIHRSVDATLSISMMASCSVVADLGCINGT